MQSSSGHNAAYAYGCVGDWVKKHGYFLIKNIRVLDSSILMVAI